METGHPHPVATTRLPGLAVAAIASIGAGAVHAAAIGVHAEHPRLAQLFVVLTVAQLGAGLWALMRPMRAAAWAVAAVNSAAVAGWLVTRLTGVSFPGLEVAESPQFADTACALMGTVAAGAALGSCLIGWRPSSPARIWAPSFAVAVLAVPAMWTGGTHVHSSHGDDHTETTVDAAGNVVEVPHEDSGDHPHDTVAGGDGTISTVHDDSADHPVDDHHDDPVAAAGWPRAWDPAAGIDLSGVPGVTAEQQARADQLIADTLRELPRWADVAVAQADGYTSIGDAGTGVEHYIKVSLVQDDVILDPTQPESLVYEVDGDKRTLTGAMFIASARPTDAPELEAWAGPLMTWHNHGDLCWDRVNGVNQVVGVVNDAGVCDRGINTGGANPMVHVWIAPHQCGPFAALEGVGAGQASVPEDERMDMCNGHADHGATPEPKPYDPTQPIDLSGFPGVTPEQQAAAENLIAVTVVRLPQWADYKVAEAAGFHSIGDAGTGHEHYVQWDWINDDIILDPDHPESLVYEPQPDGSKQLVSAMYMLPTSVDLADVPDIGGSLMQWHIHDNLCYTDDPVAPKVAGLTDGDGNCRAPLVKHDPAPMIHVWITPHKCGPFASLEGVGAGKIEEGEERLCDHAHGSG